MIQMFSVEVLLENFVVKSNSIGQSLVITQFIQCVDEMTVQL